ncbi:hypothetical protein OCH239_15640 [Roseivivax halodurans JCM 10272]|uniref:Glycosyltransferase RgtA/B/C/D-like domain-containing protein n=1 Tax=Roseivivax halodurans JCM 10272 TaxID=1449350 RepID=X7ECE2_9RHOB|nr:hypothetical protein [Roseivivax halodurans]ETX12856.1 hypothetical protein OCH239_15640 [Roseivivax halodurans JCM 10272]
MRDPQHGLGAHLVGIAALTLLLLWPALWWGGPTIYFDSGSYYEAGGEAMNFILDRSGLAELLASGGASAAGPGSGGVAEAPAGVGSGVRSVPYSVYVNLSIRLFGPAGAVVPMALITAWLLWILLAPIRPVPRFGAGSLVVMASTAPFYAAQIMPDIQASWLIAAPLVVMLRGGAPGRALAWALGIAAMAAVLVHYSHIPLAMATGGTLSLWFAMRRRWRAALLVHAPLAAALAINVAISVVIAGVGSTDAPPASRPEAQEDAPTISLAPGRLPVLLARLLEDGPALRFLSETCPENGFAICEVYDRFPESSTAALWGPDSIRNRATPDQMRRISEQEMALALKVLARDPLGQFGASAANTAEQLLRFGLEDLRFAHFRQIGPDEIEIEPVQAPPGMFETVERVQIGALSLAALGLVFFVLYVPGARGPITLLVIGLLANAFVCGALSAPAGRYQGRVIWMAVATALALTGRFPGWWRVGNGPLRSGAARL